jgi:hypothetical protein
MGYNPVKLENKQKTQFKIECPFRFCVPETGTECIAEKCALFMPIQRACSFNVSARKNSTWTPQKQ